MARLVIWEDSLCEGCRLEAKYAFDDEMTFLVSDVRCQGCRAKAGVARTWQELPDAAMDGLRLVVRPKLSGGGVGE